MIIIAIIIMQFKRDNLNKEILYNDDLLTF